MEARFVKSLSANREFSVVIGGAIKSRIPDLPGTHPHYNELKSNNEQYILHPVPPSQKYLRHGILTMCPSDAALAISLGPTNPWLIDIAKETLIFRRVGFSPTLRLLVPTFLLLNAPAWVTPLPSMQIRILSYHVIFPKKNNILSFGTMFSPDYLRRELSYWVSCYAFFKWWLLLSQHPQCLWKFTTLLALNIDLGTLTWDPGCFPFDQWSLAPTV